MKKAYLFEKTAVEQDDMQRKMQSGSPVLSKSLQPGMTTMGQPLPPGAAAPALQATPPVPQQSTGPQMGNSPYTTQGAPAAKITVAAGPSVDDVSKMKDVDTATGAVPSNQPAVDSKTPAVPASAPAAPVKNYAPALTSQGAVRGGRASEHEHITQNQALGRQAEVKLNRSKYDDKVYFTAPEMRYLVQTGQGQFDTNARQTAGYSNDLLKEDHQIWRKKMGLQDDPIPGKYHSTLDPNAYASSYDQDIQNQSPVTRLQNGNATFNKLLTSDKTPYDQGMQQVIAGRLKARQDAETAYKAAYTKNKALATEAKVSGRPGIEDELKKSQTALDEAQKLVIGTKNGGQFDKNYQEVMGAVNDIRRTVRDPNQQQAVIQQAMGPDGFKKFMDFHNQYKTTYSGNTDGAYLAKLQDDVRKEEAAKTAKDKGNKTETPVPGNSILAGTNEPGSPANIEAGNLGEARAAQGQNTRTIAEDVKSMPTADSQTLINQARGRSEQQLQKQLHIQQSLQNAYSPVPEQDWTNPLNVLALAGDRVTSTAPALWNAANHGYRLDPQDLPDNGANIAGVGIATQNLEGNAIRLSRTLERLQRERQMAGSTGQYEQLGLAAAEVSDKLKRALAEESKAVSSPDRSRALNLLRKQQLDANNAAYSQRVADAQKRGLIPAEKPQWESRPTLPQSQFEQQRGGLIPSPKDLRTVVKYPTRNV